MFRSLNHQSTQDAVHYKGTGSMSSTPTVAAQQVQSVSQAQLEDMVRNLASRVDAEGNLEHGTLELLSSIAANTTRHSTWPRSFTMTSVAAFAATRLIKGIAKAHIRVFDIRIFAAAAATFEIGRAHV